LFSGIGGISLAVLPYVQTVLYCEIEPFCQQALFERMVSGHLHPAPIHHDVRTLMIAPSMKPNMIIGGSPCQDVSSMGNMKGIVEGNRSGLFFEIMRIVDECPSISVLFLENVANILHVGMKEVIEELGKRGFNLQWTVKSASSQGAPHMRNRWFCLAVRGEEAASILKFDTVQEGTQCALPNWDTEPSPRVTFKPSSGVEDPSYDCNWISRCQSLGNAVVPGVVRRVFLDLVASFHKWPALADCLADFGTPLEFAGLKYPYPETGLLYQGVYYAIPKKHTMHVRHTVDTSIVDPTTNKLIKMVHWPTPRRGLTHASTLTERSMRDLPTVLINSEVSKAYVRSNGCIAATGDGAATDAVPETEASAPVLSDNADQADDAASSDTANDPDPDPDVLHPHPDDAGAAASFPAQPTSNVASLHGDLIANVNYIEWMMGYPQDWTKISRNMKEKRSPVEDVEEEVSSDNDDETSRPRKLKQRRARPRQPRGASSHSVSIHYNGMHMLMREHRGKDIRHIAQIWKALSGDDQKKYTEQARSMRA
jgi:DNA (cytosine-5)-methyltransferase 1